MKHKYEMRLGYARSMASTLIELLKPACQRIAVVGGVRRGRARANGIKIVAIPRFEDFSEPTHVNLLDERCDELLVEGVLEPDDRVVLVEDVVTTGGAALQAVQALRAAGAEVVCALVVLDRLEGAAEAFAAAGVPCRALLTSADLGMQEADT